MDLGTEGKVQRLAQSLLFSAPGMAIVMAHLPSYVLVRRFGAHRTMLAALLLSAAVTAAFPFLLNLVDGPLLLPLAMLIRVLQGCSVAPAFSFLGQMSARWATVGEQYFFLLVGFLAVQFGPMFSWFSTVSLLPPADQSARLRLFELHSAVCLVIALFWLFFYRDEPHAHGLVNGEELNLIVKKKPRPGRAVPLPGGPSSLLCLLARSTSAWACWLASFCYFFALLSLLIFHPIFVHKVLLQTLGPSLLLPFALLFLSHLLFPALASCPCLFPSSRPATWKVRLFNSAAFGLSSLAFLGIAIVPGHSQLMSAVRRLWLLWLCLLPLGASSLGFLKSLALTGGGHFTQYLVSHMQIAFGLAYALVPTLLYSSMARGSMVHWRLLFLAAALLLLLGMAVFLILGRGTPTSWAEQWTEEARGDAPLLLVKFSPIHRPNTAAGTSAILEEGS